MSENDLDQSNELQIGIIDEPNPKGGIDTLEIKKHADALTTFIKYTAKITNESKIVPPNIAENTWELLSPKRLEITGEIDVNDADINIIMIAIIGTRTPPHIYSDLGDLAKL